MDTKVGFQIGQERFEDGRVRFTLGIGEDAASAVPIGELIFPNLETFNAFGLSFNVGANVLGVLSEMGIVANVPAPAPPPQSRLLRPDLADKNTRQQLLARR